MKAIQRTKHKIQYIWMLRQNDWNLKKKKKKEQKVKVEDRGNFTVKWQDKSPLAWCKWKKASCMCMYWRPCFIGHPKGDLPCNSTVSWSLAAYRSWSSNLDIYLSWLWAYPMAQYYILVGIEAFSLAIWFIPLKFIL